MNIEARLIPIQPNHLQPDTEPALAISGFPSAAEDCLEDEVDISTCFIRNRTATYLYRVDGDSMIDYHICHNDIVAADGSIRPRNGHLVIAVLNGEFILKQFFKNDRNVILRSFNRRCKDIVLMEGQELKIRGVVVQISRDILNYRQ